MCQIVLSIPSHHVVLSRVSAFRKEPAAPPSPAQAALLEAITHEDYRGSLHRLFTNRGFLILLLTYGKSNRNIIVSTVTTQINKEAVIILLWVLLLVLNLLLVLLYRLVLRLFLPVLLLPSSSLLLFSSSSSSRSSSYCVYSKDHSLKTNMMSHCASRSLLCASPSKSNKSALNSAYSLASWYPTNLLH